MTNRIESFALAGTLLVAALLLILCVAVDSALAQAHNDESRSITDLGRSVFRVDTEAGHGSGFLVDPERGFVVTNYHVVRLGSGLSRHIAVALPDGNGDGNSEISVAARVIHASAEDDIAILQIAPDYAARYPGVIVPDNDRSSVLDSVVAIGSPLSLGMQFTLGHISNLSESFGTGDFLIQPGNSGGPVLHVDSGELAGVATFGVGGIAGFVRSGVVLETLREAKSKPLRDPPSAVPLPANEFVGPYPARLLLERTKEAYENRESRNGCGGEFGKQPQSGEFKQNWCNEIQNDRFRINVNTPVTNYYSLLTAKMHTEKNRERRRGRNIEDDTYRESLNFYDWYDIATQNDTTLAPVVTIWAYPKIGQTGGSIARQIAGAVTSSAIGGVTGVYTPIAVPFNLKYKGEFHEFKVFADGVELHPVRRARHLQSVQEEGYIEMRDEAYAGMYQYNLRDFAEAEEIVIEIFEARNPSKPMDKRFMLRRDDLIHEQIRADYDALQKWHETRDTSSPEKQP